MAAFSFSKIVDKVKQQRERVVIILLLGVLLGVSWNIYALFQLQKRDQDSITWQILVDHGYQDPVAEEDLEAEVDPLQVARALVEVPSPEEIVRPLIEGDPLTPGEDIHQLQRRIGMLMEEGRVLRDQGKWADAIVIYDMVLDWDPAGAKYEYRGGTPQELKDFCIRQQTRERMVQARTEADRANDRGRELLEEGDEIKARDVLLQAAKAYGQILDTDPDRTILDEGFYADIDSRLEELAEITGRLIRKTLHQDIASKREQAEQELAAYQADLSAVGHLAAAKEALIESLDIVELVDPGGTIVAATEVEEIELRLSEVEEMVSEALPGLIKKVGDQIAALNDARTVEEGIVRAEATLESLSYLRRLRPEEIVYEQRYNEVQAVLGNLRRNLDLQRAQAIYAEAEAHFERALRAHERNDLATAANERESALAVLARMRSLPEENVAPWLAQAGELERKIKLQIQSLPLIDDVEVTAVDPQGKWVRLRSRTRVWPETMHHLNVTNTATKIKLEEVYPNPEGEPPYAVISKPLHARTKVSIGTG